MKYNYKDIVLEWIGHDSFKIKVSGKVIYIDPYADGDYRDKADYVIVSHKHYDHCSKEKISEILRDGTLVVSADGCDVDWSNVKIMKEGEVYEDDFLKIYAVPAYNVNKPFHPRGLGNGYVIDISGVKIYFAGDTDLIPEMKDIGDLDIDIALIPISGVYVMDENEAFKAIGLLRPKVVIPMHYDYLEGLEKDPEKFKEKVEREYKDVQVVIL